MAEIVQGRKIVFDRSDWLGGNIDQYDRLTDRAEAIGGTISYSRGMNPYRFLGHASPGYQPQGAVNRTSLASGLRAGVVDGQNAYATGFSTDIAKISLSVTPDVVDDATWPWTITAHAAANTPVADDIMVYTRNVGGTPTRRILYSWSDSVSWDVGDFDLSSTLNDDFMQTVVANPLTTPYSTGGQGKKHPMVRGDDDIAYIADRNFVHAYDGQDGTDGTFSEEVFKVGNGMEIKSMTTYQGYLVMFAYRASTTSGTSYYQGETKAYFWDYLKQDPDYIFNLNDNYVGECFSYQGKLGVFTAGRTNDLENGGDFSSKLQFFQDYTSGFASKKTFNTAVPERGGVYVNDQMVMWNSEGQLLSYGAPYPGLDNVLNCLAVGATSSTVSGMLLNPTSNFQILSPSTASDGRLVYLASGNYYESCIFATANVSPTFADDEIGQVEAVKVFFMRPVSGGRQITITLANESGTTTTVTSALSTVTSSLVVRKFQGTANKLRFSSIKAIAQYASGSGQSGAPLISRIEVFYTPVKLQI